MKLNIINENKKFNLWIPKFGLYLFFKLSKKYNMKLPYFKATKILKDFKGLPILEIENSENERVVITL